MQNWQKALRKAHAGRISEKERKKSFHRQLNHFPFRSIYKALKGYVISNYFDSINSSLNEFK
jgi:hypothetical protein